MSFIFFLSNLHTCCFLSFLNTLARSPSTLLIRVTIRHCCLVLELRRKQLSVSPLSRILDVGFFCPRSLSRWGSSLYSYFLWILIMNKCWILSTSFSALNDKILWFSFLSLLKWWVTLTDFQILDQASMSTIIHTLS